MEIILSNFLESTFTDQPLPKSQRFTKHVFMKHVLKNFDSRGLIFSFVGSFREFNALPIVPIANNINIMLFSNGQLAVPCGHHWSVEIDLPIEFDTCAQIEVYEFVDSGFPGYVFIRFAGHLQKLRQSCKFNFTSMHVFDYSTRQAEPFIDKTTARMASWFNENAVLNDVVFSLRCLQWPPQAEEWFTRKRNHSWPAVRTVQQVVSDGCNLVQLTHSQCRQESWYRLRMWRLSFSRAEIHLLNSWTIKQQVTYHIARFVVKMINMKPDMDSLVKSYHVKTLMLWACEQFSEKQWYEPVICITSSLLRTLTNMLQAGVCQHYFIHKCNLFDHQSFKTSSNVKAISSRLSSLTVTELSHFLLNNYVDKCIQLCPDSLQPIIYAAIADDERRQIGLLHISSWWAESLKERGFKEFFLIIMKLEKLLRKSDMLAVHVYFQLFETLTEADYRLVDCFIALSILHFVRLMNRVRNDSIVEENLFKLIWWLKHCNNVEQSSSLFKRGLFTVAIDSVTEVQRRKTDANPLVLVELAKAFLHLSLTRTDNDFGSVYEVHVKILARIYLAGLYYHTRQYYTAVHHSLSAIKLSQSHGSLLVMERKLLLNDDVDVSLASGLTVLYDFIHSSYLHQRRQAARLVDVFTGRLYSFFIIIHCLSRLQAGDAGGADCTGVLRCLKRQICRSSGLFVNDFLLSFFAMTIGKQLKTTKFPTGGLECRRAELVVKHSVFKTARLRCLLMQAASNRLKNLRRLMYRDYKAITSLATADYDAMYAWKCGELSRCTQLSEHSLRSIQLGGCCIPVMKIPLSDLVMLADDSLQVFCELFRMVDYKRICSDEYLSQNAYLLHLLSQCKLDVTRRVSLARNILRFLSRSGSRPVDYLLLALTYRKIVRGLPRIHRC